MTWRYAALFVVVALVVVAALFTVSLMFDPGGPWTRIQHLGVANV